MNDKAKPSPGPWAWDPEDPEDGEPYSLFSKGVPYSGSGLSVYFEPGDTATPQDLANLALIVRAPEMAAMLRSLEWSGGGSYEDPLSHVRVRNAEVRCPECLETKHAPDCRLAALLKEIS